MTEPTISCPNCKTDIRLTESLAAPLIAETRRRFEQQLAAKDQNIARREAAIGAQKSELAKEKAAFDETIAEKLTAERSRIAAEEAQKAKVRAAADLDEKAKQLAELQGVLKARDEKLAEAQRAQAVFLEKERALDDAKREMELTIQKRIGEGLDSERAKAKLEAEAALNLRVAEKDQLIASMQNTIADLKRKAEQGSQQLQGEVLELELESLLKAKFPFDGFDPVPKGEFGGDLVQRVVNASGVPCGSILWETKRTKNWGGDWIAKLREDQRRAKSDIAIIVSTALPKGVQTFDQVDGVWVTDFRCALPVAFALRQLLLDVAAARIAGEGQQSKMELVYDYLTGPRFRHRIEAIVEKFDEMRADLDKERKAMTKLWAKREMQITGVIEATAGMYGDLQGIAGKALKEIDGFELLGIEDKSDASDEPAEV
ncbi:MAG TPA: DUF2130 domain-containing protein [Hyphomicrobium sp.]|nr:DUF2130 domain-containing protein [Hyphomicrobium sp.]